MRFVWQRTTFCTALIFALWLAVSASAASVEYRETLTEEIVAYRDVQDGNALVVSSEPEQNFSLPKYDSDWPLENITITLYGRYAAMTTMTSEFVSENPPQVPYDASHDWSARVDSNQFDDLHWSPEEFNESGLHPFGGTVLVAVIPDDDEPVPVDSYEVPSESWPSFIGSGTIDGVISANIYAHAYDDGCAFGPSFNCTKTIEARLDATVEISYAFDPLVGDYNRDGNVDAADYAVWRRNAGTNGLAPYDGADGTGDGNVNAADYNAWRQNFGASATSASSHSRHVPEPTSMLLLFAGLASSICCACRNTLQSEFQNP